jgi:hypothetical protein
MGYTKVHRKFPGIWHYLDFLEAVLDIEQKVQKC